MSKPGKRSKESNAYFYPDDKDGKDKYFFKVLVGEFRERLAVPDKFEQHFRGLIGNRVKLESRCGHTFDAEVAKNLGKVVLQTGWKEFVTAHDLNMGDFLVFKCDGTSRLKVFIFDLSCCEKVPPCRVKRNHICGRETREINTETSSTCGDLPLNVTASSSTSPSDSSGDSISPEDQKSHYVPGYILPRRTYLTCVQMKKLKERVRASTSTIPIYGCIVKKSNLRRGSQAMNRGFPALRGSELRFQKQDRGTEVPVGGELEFLAITIFFLQSHIPANPLQAKLNHIILLPIFLGQDIPRVYADVHLPFENQTLMLQCCGQSWDVRCITHKGRPNRGKSLSQGWKQFARDNKLQVGDLCLFELLENTKYTMNVHIIRAK